MVVIPFGGATITKDICELNLIESDAEEHKKKYGKTHDTENSSASNLLANKNSKNDVDFSQLTNVIEMRVREIVLNIKEQIKASGYEGELGAGVVITGGGSQLKNLDLYLEEKLDMPVRKASAKRAYVNNFPELANDPSLTQALGLLMYGRQNCEEQVEEKSEVYDRGNSKDASKGSKPKHPKEPKKKGIFERVGTLFGTMFDEEEEID